MSVEIVKIRNCPVCNNNHVYVLEVSRDAFIGFQKSKAKEEEVSYTRIFACPATGEYFKAKITLHQRLNNKIRSITVKGISSQGGKDE